MTLILTAGLARGAVYDFTEGNKLTLLQKAREATELKLDLVRHAKHHIHIVTYYWDKKGFPIELMKELKKAHARGVDVRLMSTYIPSITMDVFGKARRTLDIYRSRKESAATLAYLRLTPGYDETWTNNIHEKIFLVDGKVAILGGRNISDNDYRAKDLEMKIEGPVVNQVQEHFRKLFDFLVKLKVLKHCEMGKVICEYKYNSLRFSKDDPAFFPEQTIYENGAKARVLTNEVLFAQFNKKLTDEEKVSMKDDIINEVVKVDFDRLRAYNYFVLPTVSYRQFLEKNIKEKKDVRMISNSLISSAFISNRGYLVSLPGLKSLVDEGLNLSQWSGSAMSGTDKLEYLHEKVLLFNDDHGFVGSHNFGIGSTAVSSEICLEFFDRPIVQTLSNVFDKEFTDRNITTPATSMSLQNEIDHNREMIEFLSVNPLQTILKMLY